MTSRGVSNICACRAAVPRSFKHERFGATLLNLIHLRAAQVAALYDRPNRGIFPAVFNVQRSFTAYR
jgi:hypothetical protein